MKFYWIYGVVICILFAAAGARGYVVSSMMQPARWSPQGHAIHK
jgi:hypothetical protein